MQAKNFQWAKQAGLVLAGRGSEGEYQFTGTSSQWYWYEQYQKTNVINWLPITKAL